MKLLLTRIHNQTGRGFTLVELLVVISIIGILASVILASLNSAREKGANSRTIQQVKEYQKAFEIYRSDVGHYPDAPSGTCLGQYSAETPFIANQCGLVGTPILFTVDTGMESEVADYIRMDSIPGEAEIISYFGSPYRGILYSYNSATPGSGFIYYRLDGASSDCIIADATEVPTGGDNTLCYLTF